MVIRNLTWVINLLTKGTETLIKVMLNRRSWAPGELEIKSRRQRCSQIKYSSYERRKLSASLGIDSKST